MTGKKRCHFWIQGLVEQRAGCLTASHENGIRPIPLVAWETDFSKAGDGQHSVAILPS